MYDTLPRERSPLHEEIPPSREDQNLRSLIVDEVFSNINEEEENASGNNIVISREHPVPHEEEGVVISPKRETLAHLQGFPKNLTYEDHGTVHVQHVLSLTNC